MQPADAVVELVCGCLFAGAETYHVQLEGDRGLSWAAATAFLAQHKAQYQAANGRADMVSGFFLSTLSQNQGSTGGHHILLLILQHSKIPNYGADHSSVCS